MAANTDRGELDIEIADKVRRLRFRTSEVIALEKMLGQEVMGYIIGGHGQLQFLRDAIFCGLVSRDPKLNPVRVAGWLDLYTGSLYTLKCDILYAIARGKPADEGEDMVRVLGEILTKPVDVENDPTKPGEDGKSPLSESSPQPTSATSESSTPPPSD